MLHPFVFKASIIIKVDRSIVRPFTPGRKRSRPASCSHTHSAQCEETGTQTFTTSQRSRSGTSIVLRSLILSNVDGEERNEGEKRTERYEEEA